MSLSSRQADRVASGQKVIIYLRGRLDEAEADPETRQLVEWSCGQNAQVQ